MSDQEKSDYPLLWYWYQIGITTGLDKTRAKLFASAQISNEYKITHLRVFES